MEQLQNLLNYTSFHLGMYTTLIALLVSLLGLGLTKGKIDRVRWWLFATLMCFTGAAVFGGLVGSSIPYHKDFDSFANAWLGPWRCEVIPALWCTHLEHSIFWCGVVTALIATFYAMRTNKPRERAKA
jgi:hypothetical protein